MNKLAILALSGLALPLAAGAQGLSYNYLDARYISQDVDITTSDGLGLFATDEIGLEGFSIDGSMLIHENVYLFAGYDQQRSDTVNLVLAGNGKYEIDTITAGLGYRVSMAPDTDFNISAAWVREEGKGVDGLNVPEIDDDGYRIALGIRHLLSEFLELNAGASYINIFDDDVTSFTAGLLGHLTPRFAIGAAYAVNSDADGFSVGLRLKF